MVNGIESHGRNLMSYRRLVEIIMSQIVMMLMLINIKSNVQHH